MRISDWSSDVCSSDLAAKVPVLVSPLTDLPSSFEQLGATQSNAGRLKAAGVDVSVGVFDDDDAHKMGYATQYAGNLVGLTRVPSASGLSWDQAFAAINSVPARAVGMEGERKGVVEGKSGSVRVDLGGGGTINKK